MGSDLPCGCCDTIAVRFLSTLPAWGATNASRMGVPQKRDFYPRSPRGERLYAILIQSFITPFLSTLPAWGATIVCFANQITTNISIHAPRVGSDHAQGNYSTAVGEFLSTLPAWGATNLFGRTVTAENYFYPRSPRGERPFPSFFYMLIYIDFYPRSPRGERRAVLSRFSGWFIFLSTLPAWGATWRG